MGSFNRFIKDKNLEIKNMGQKNNIPKVGKAPVRAPSVLESELISTFNASPGNVTEYGLPCNRII
jgi:hypothetical protein